MSKPAVKKQPGVEEVIDSPVKSTGGVWEMFETDAKAEVDGIWVNYGKFKVKLARAGGENKRYISILRQLTKPYKRASETGTLDPVIERKLVITAFVRGVILGWEGITDRDGKPLPFNEANAISIFTALPQFFQDISAMSMDFTLFRVQEQEEEAKN